MGVGGITPSANSRTFPPPGAFQPSLQRTLDTLSVSPGHWLLGEGGSVGAFLSLREGGTHLLGRSSD